MRDEFSPSPFQGDGETLGRKILILVDEMWTLRLVL